MNPEGDRKYRTFTRTDHLPGASSVVLVTSSELLHSRCAGPSYVGVGIYRTRKLRTRHPRQPLNRQPRLTVHIYTCCTSKSPVGHHFDSSSVRSFQHAVLTSITCSPELYRRGPSVRPRPPEDSGWLRLHRGQPRRYLHFALHHGPESVHHGHQRRARSVRTLIPGRLMPLSRCHLSSEFGKNSIRARTGQHQTNYRSEMYRERDRMQG